MKPVNYVRRSTRLCSEVALFSTVARRCLRAPWGLRSTPTSDSDEITSTEEADVYAVQATLKYIGPDHCLALQFPHLDTSAQRARNISGISLDFVLDTAANTNTINAQAAQELQLPVVGQAMPEVGIADMIQGRQTFLLGDAELDETGQNFTFMTGSTASTLAIENSATELYGRPLRPWRSSNVPYQYAGPSLLGR